MRIGFFLATEEFTPDELLTQARAAEEAGFHGLWISDHYHPWNREQGQSPFVWSVLGAVSQVTSRGPVTTAVTCPTLRIHPAVMAQAAATTAVDLAARIGDGYVITMPDADLIGRFRSNGGADKVVQAGMKVCWGADELYIHQIGGPGDDFFGTYAKEILRRFSG
jgi:hypothetical protein